MIAKFLKINAYSTEALWSLLGGLGVVLGWLGGVVLGESLLLGSLHFLRGRVAHMRGSALSQSWHIFLRS